MLALIGWVGRFLLILFVVRMVLRLFMPSPARGPFAGRRPQPERVGGQLVRCAQCGTYVPVSTVINAPQSGSIVHFCTDTCRQQYAAAHP